MSKRARSREAPAPNVVKEPQPPSGIVDVPPGTADVLPPRQTDVVPDLVRQPTVQDDVVWP